MFPLFTGACKIAQKYKRLLALQKLVTPNIFPSKLPDAQLYYSTCDLLPVTGFQWLIRSTGRGLFFVNYWQNTRFPTLLRIADRIRLWGIPHMHIFI